MYPPPNGLKFEDDRLIQGEYNLEMVFKLDSSQNRSFHNYQCPGQYQGVPIGKTLIDAWGPDSGGWNEGAFMISYGNNGQLCVQSSPKIGGWLSYENIQGQVPFDTCTKLTFNRSTAGLMTLTVEADGVVNAWTKQGSGGSASWRAGRNDICVGCETNGYTDSRDEPPAGATFYEVVYNGASVDMVNGGYTVGNAERNLLASCGALPPPPPPPPPPEPEPAACELDPTSFACACETNNWPECTACQIQ